ncbi:hypothetical protein OG21DRAFT_1439075 [Imleria badia]|nr:hypothetical protein OG21DRAFT_1439075 [Imleria badia]
MTSNDVTNATLADSENRLLAEPKGWNSDSAALESTTCMLASTVGAPPSSIKNILEEREFDHYVFSYNNIFYLLGCSSGDTYEIENPRAQKELWSVLKHEDWYNHLTLKEV